MTLKVRMCSRRSCFPPCHPTPSPMHAVRLSRLRTHRLWMSRHATLPPPTWLSAVSLALITLPHGTSCGSPATTLIASGCHVTPYHSSLPWHLAPSPMARSAFEHRHGRRHSAPISSECSAWFPRRRLCSGHSRMFARRSQELRVADILVLSLSECRSTHASTRCRVTAGIAA